MEKSIKKCDYLKTTKRTTEGTLWYLQALYSKWRELNEWNNILKLCYGAY